MRTILNMLDKTAGISDIAAEFVHHLPRIRTLDTVAGGLLGAAGGTGLYGIRRALSSAKDRKQFGWGSALAHAGLGGLVGAGAANVVGDRVRRYVANAIPLRGYYFADTEDRRVLPKSWQEFYNAAIADVPLQRGKTDVVTAANTDTPVLVRRELLRRTLGLPVRPRDANLTYIGTRTFSPTYNSRGLPVGGGIPGEYQHYELNPQFFEKYKDNSYVRNMLDKLRMYRPADSPTSAEAWQPYSPADDFLSRHDTSSAFANLHTVRDHWDFGLTPDENRVLPQLISRYLRRGTAEKTNWDFVATLERLKHEGRVELAADTPWTPAKWLPTLLSRKLLNDVLGNRGVVFEQSFDTTGGKATPLFAGRENRPPSEAVQALWKLLDKQ